MRFDFTTSVGGRPLRDARDLLRKAQVYTPSWVAEVLGLPLPLAKAYLRVLNQAGYIELSSTGIQDSAEPVFEVTRLGVSLMKAKIRRRLNKHEAEAVVASLLTAIEAVNADPELISSVDEADLFGSYVTGAGDLGDVDVAISLSRRILGKKWVQASLRRGEAAGVRSFFQRVMWGDAEVEKRLRAVSRYLDIQPKSDIVVLGAVMQPIYRRKSEQKS